MSTIIARSAESVHWYKKDGSPQYTVKAKDGSNRPTTLRDARAMQLVPSVTTILKVAAKPALEAWKMEQMLLAALTLPRLEGESEKDLINRIAFDSKETGKQAAERGSRIVVDVKTKEFNEGDKEAAYDEHLMQLAAYRYGLDLPKARCANIFVSATNHGLVHIHEWTDDELRKGWEMFQCLHKYWQLKNTFGHSYA